MNVHPCDVCGRATYNWSVCSYSCKIAQRAEEMREDGKTEEEIEKMAKEAEEDGPQ
jgi:hypothetical protein